MGAVVSSKNGPKCDHGGVNPRFPLVKPPFVPCVDGAGKRKAKFPPRHDDACVHEDLPQPPRRPIYRTTEAGSPAIHPKFQLESAS